MNELKPIVCIDDDLDDMELLVEAYKMLPYNNKLLIFHDSTRAYDYLTENKVIPLVVISDILMPKMTGHELYEKLQASGAFSKHYVPFVYFTGIPKLPPSTDGIPTAHGYFEKKSDFGELRATLQTIIDYYGAPVNR